MNIAIAGAGAVGSLIGGLLSLKGHHVSFLPGSRNSPSTEKQGLRLVLPDRWLRASGLTYNGGGNADLLFVALKRHHLRALKKGCFERVIRAPAGAAVFFNADPEEAERLAPAGTEVSLCLTLMTAVKLQEAEVELATPHPFIVVQRQRDAVQILSGLKSFGFECLNVDDIKPYANSFFIYQLLSLPVAMCRTTIENFFSYPEGRKLASLVLQEGVKTFSRAGEALGRLPSMDPRELLKHMDKKQKLLDGFRFVPGRSYNSLLQSILKGKTIEVREINKRLIEMASGQGVSLTWNWRLLQKLPRVLRVGFFRNPIELWKALV